MNNNFLSTGILAITLLFFSCEDDIYEGDTTTTNYENEIAEGTIRHNLDIQVLSTSVSTSKTNGLLDAKVTISQNGVDITADVGASGIASFTGLFEGHYSYYVEATGHLAYNSSVYLDNDYYVDLDDTDADLIQNNQLTVVLPRTNGEVKGSFYHEINSVTGTSTGAITKEDFNYIITCDDKQLEPNVFTGKCDGNGKMDALTLPEGVDLSIEVFTVKSITGSFTNVPFDKKFSYTGNFKIKASEVMYLGLSRVD